TMKVALIALLAIGASAELREKRQWFGGFGWPSAVVQPTVHTTSVQQPVVTQEVQQPVYQTQFATPIVQNHEHVVGTPVYKHVQHTVNVPTPVVDPVVITPRIIVPKPSTTKISVIQRVKRQILYQFWGGVWGAAPLEVAPAAHVHTNVVNPPLVQQVCHLPAPVSSLIPGSAGCPPRRAHSGRPARRPHPVHRSQTCSP
ncbi:hypothetical protein PMAYCL1PPCAC_19078, partial [Pristionchus mayeri]